MADEIKNTQTKNMMKPFVNNIKSGLTTCSSSATLATLRSEDSLSPVRSTTEKSNNSDISCQIRICLLNQVLPEERRLKEVERRPLRVARPTRKISRDRGNQGSQRAVSVPKFSSSNATAEDKTFNAEQTNKCDFKQRTKAFDFLQSLAVNVRGDNSMIIEEDKPHEYLKVIHESQKNHFKPKSPACCTTSSAKLSKVSSFKSHGEKESEVTMSSVLPKTSKTSKPKSLVSKEIIVGLDSILKTLGEPETKSTTRPLRKRKSLRRSKAFKAKISPVKRSQKINIPTERLLSIVDSLSLI